MRKPRSELTDQEDSEVIYPKLDPLHTVGTKVYQYRLTLPARQRRQAISAGIIESTHIAGAYDPLHVRSIIMRKRKRILLLRTMHKNTKYCKVLHADVLWLDKTYGIDSSGLHAICSVS